MRFPVMISIAVACLLSIACSGSGSRALAPSVVVSPAETGLAAPACTPPAARDITPMNPWADATRTAIEPKCGSCHRSDLATAVPGALRIFDLTQDPWWETMSDPQLESLARRIRSGPLPQPDKDLVERFVVCARGGSCGMDGS